MTDVVDPEGNETRTIHELVNFSGKDVLEIGCGDGRLIRRYADSVRSVLGIDAVQTDIDKARSNSAAHLANAVQFRCVDALSVELAPASFDVVVLGRSI